MWARSRVLVTGGAGFIGSALVWELNRRGCASVVIADSVAAAARQHNLRPLQFTDYLEPHEALARLRRGTQLADALGLALFVTTATSTGLATGAPGITSAPARSIPATGRPCPRTGLACTRGCPHLG